MFVRVHDHIDIPQIDTDLHISVVKYGSSDIIVFEIPQLTTKTVICDNDLVLKCSLIFAPYDFTIYITIYIKPVWYSMWSTSDVDHQIQTSKPFQHHFSNGIFKCIFVNKTICIFIESSPNILPQVWK